MFLLLGVGAGAVYAAYGLGLVLTHRATGVVNFAHGALAMVVTYVFVELRVRGDLVVPVPGIDLRLHVGDRPALAVCLALALAVAAVLGVAAHALVFRPLRQAPALAGVVASVGVMITLQAAVVARFGTANRTVPAILPARPITLGGLTFPSDRALLAGLAVVAAAGLAAAGRLTRAGLAVRAAADDDVGVALLGISPSVLGAGATALATVVAGAAGILAGPVTALDPVTSTLLVVPALAAALVGRLRSFGVTVAAALALGVAQSGVVLVQSRVEWLPRLGLQAGLPVLVIVVALAARRPDLGAGARGAHRAGRSPASPRPRPPLPAAAAGLATAAVALALTGGTTRAALVHSMVGAVVCLSIVVLTGYVGQISLAQMAFAGVAGFTLSRLGAGAGVPFPIAPLLAAAVAAAVGLALGVPALRLRGSGLAVVTLAGAVAIEELVFKQVVVSGGFAGTGVPAPSLFGLDLGPGAGTGPSLTFGLLVAVVLTGAGLAVAVLRRGAAGRRLLAVRANEHAAAALGIPVARVKLTAFTVSAFVAGVGGTLVGYEQGQLSFQSFGVFVSLAYLAVTYLGGVGAVTGALVGGALVPGGIVFSVLERAGGLGRHQLLATGVALVAITVVCPDGVAGAVHRLASRWRPPPAGDAPLAFSRDEPTETVGPSLENVPEPAGGGVATGAGGGGGAPAEALLDVDHLTVAFGGVHALDGVSVRVRAGTVTGLIGPNGAGKTSLLDAVCGFAPVASGSVVLAGHRLDGLAPHRRARLGLGRTFQSLELFEDLTVGEQVLAAAEATGSPPHPAGVGDVVDRRPTELAHGERKRVALARALVGRPRLLVLDEPAAGLDPEGRRQLGERMRAVAATGERAVLVADHDMELVLDVCDEVWVLDQGRVVAHGAPAAVRADPQVVAAYLGDGAPAPAPADRRPRAVAADAPTVLEAEGLVAGYGGVAVVRDLDLRVRAGEVVALLGRNGAGKTTTVLALTGILTPLAGRARVLGQAAEGRPHRLARRGAAVVPQGRRVFPGLTVAEHLRLAGGATDAALAAFPALAPLRDRRAGLLSGGEQQMLALATALAARPKLLVVDEVSLGLAPRLAGELLATIRAMADDGCAVLVVEQHPALALGVADRAVVLDRGRVVAQGPASELADRPDLVRTAYLGG